MNEAPIQVEPATSPVAETVIKTPQPEVNQGDITPQEEITHLEKMQEKNGGEAVFKDEVSETDSKDKKEDETRPEPGPTLQEQYNELIRRGEATGRDVDFDLDVLKYRTKDGKLKIVNPNNLSEESIIAVKNYVLALEMAKADPENATVESLIKGLTGFDSDQHDEIIRYLRQVHLLTHDMYDLPDDGLMQLGRQQEYADQLIEKITAHNIDLRYEPIPGSAPANFTPGATTAITESSTHKFRGTITVDPEKINITHGSQVLPALAHEYVHALQFTTLRDTVGRHTNLAVMEFDAYLATMIIDETTDWRYIEGIFNNILYSFKSGKCIINQNPDPNPLSKGPKTLK